MASRTGADVDEAPRSGEGGGNNGTGDGHATTHRQPGAYTGLAYRRDADLKAWLEKRPREAAIDPDLPIIDPHHHFWDTPARGSYFLPDLLADIGTGGHNIVSTVFLECQAMCRKDGPPEMAPVGEVEFVNGIAAMSASGNYGPCRVAEGIISQADLTLGAGVRDVL